MTTSPSPATPDKTLSRDLASGALALAIAEIAGSITGAVTNEDVLGTIFSRFCIGK